MNNAMISIRLNLNKPEDFAVWEFWTKLQSDWGDVSHREILFGVLRMAYPKTMNESAALGNQDYRSANLINLGDLPPVGRTNLKLATGEWKAWYTVPDYSPRRGLVYTVTSISYDRENPNGLWYTLTASRKVKTHENRQNQRVKNRVFQLTESDKIRIHYAPSN